MSKQESAKNEWLGIRLVESQEQKAKAENFPKDKEN